MSGGCYNYAYRHILDLADALQPTTPLRKAFATHLRSVAIAAHAIEWVDSGDVALEGEEESIRRALNVDVKTLVSQALVEKAERFLEDVKALVEPTKGD